MQKLPAPKVYVLKGVTPSYNRIKNLHWSRVRGRGGIRDEWYWLVKGELHVREPKIRAFADVRIVRVGKHTLDYDNFVAGCKYLVDALTQFGHIFDDTTEWVRVDYEQRKALKGEDEHMEVTVKYRIPASSAASRLKSRI